MKYITSINIYNEPTTNFYLIFQILNFNVIYILSILKMLNIKSIAIYNTIALLRYYILYHYQTFVIIKLSSGIKFQFVRIKFRLFIIKFKINI